MSHAMSRITSVIKAAYNFLVGDAIILVAVVAAFIIGEILVHATTIANPIVAVVFIGIIIAGLVATLGRELVGRQR